ncbi:unnamed protein product, partial [Amoebophrya sp. A25]
SKDDKKGDGHVKESDISKVESSSSKKDKILPGQKIKNDKTGKMEVLKVPEEFKVKDGVLTQFSVYRRPELNAPTYHAQDPHLLDFGGTEFGTIDLIGQSA